jgi:hypothetical protein
LFNELPDLFNVLMTQWRVVLVVDEWYMSFTDDPSLGYALGLGGAEIFSPVISCFRRWFSRLGYKPI